MSRLAINGNNQLLEKLKNPEIALADPPRITASLIGKYLTVKFDPNVEYKYGDGKRVITQAIDNLRLAKGRSNSVQENCLQVIGALIKGGAILSDTDEANLTQLVPNWKDILGYSGNKPNMMIASNIIKTEILYGPNLEAGTERDMYQYMGPKGGRRKSRKVKRSSKNRSRRSSSRKFRTKKLGLKLRSRKLGRKLKGG